MFDDGFPIDQRVKSLLLMAKSRYVFGYAPTMAMLIKIYIYIYINIILLVNVGCIRVIPINILADDVMKTPILVSPVGPEHITIGIQRSQHTSKMELVGVIPFYQFPWCLRNI